MNLPRYTRSTGGDLEPYESGDLVKYQDIEPLLALLQASYNLSMLIRESVAPHDAGVQSDDWPLELATDDQTTAFRLADFISSQERALAACGCPVNGKEVSGV